MVGGVIIGEAEPLEGVTVSELIQEAFQAYMLSEEELASAEIALSPWAPRPGQGMSEEWQPVLDSQGRIIGWLAPEWPAALDDWPRLSGMLRAAAWGKGNFGIGEATREQAQAMGEAWVGAGFRVASDGETLISVDGLRQYRPPSYKPNLDKVQANFEKRPPGMTQWQSNAHLDITD